MDRAEAIERLEQLYASLPSIQCRGLCYGQCSLVTGAQLERDRVLERGIDLGPVITSRRVAAGFVAGGHQPRCPALSAINTCRVYDVRPLVCRAYGVVEGLRCGHGCVPDGMISDAQFIAIRDEIEELSELVTGVSRRPEG